MARRNRDYKAEYARRKAKARAAGYKSEREYKAARKALGTPKNASPLPKKVVKKRRDIEAKAWSERKSHNPGSRFLGNMSDERKEMYHRLYINPIKDREKWRKEFYRYLVPKVYTHEEFIQRYGPVNG